MNSFKLSRLGTIMRSEPGNQMEVEGVLNPAAIRGPDGTLFLFPRLVATGNYSCIGIAKVLFNNDGDPTGVERVGIALEPETDYEKHPDGGGCEDPRITFFEPLKQFIMTYTAFSANGPRIALAVSKDLIKWERLGLADFAPFKNIEFNGVNNKDACIFPQALLSPHGHLSLVMLYRPLFRGTRPEDILHDPINRRIRDHHECIWISYSHLNSTGYKADQLPQFESNSSLALPVQPWEKLKIGAGTPPVLTKHGWLFLYHGVVQVNETSVQTQELVYSAGIMILNKEKPGHIVYRSTQPILTPELPEEKVGAVANVVFPTGIDQRNDLGLPNRFDVYYGMADNCIGVACLNVPDQLPKDV